MGIISVLLMLAAAIFITGMVLSSEKKNKQGNNKSRINEA